MESPDPIRIALAGDHPLNLHALAVLLRQQDRFRVVSISKDAKQLAGSITLGGQSDHPHIALIDINFDLHRAAAVISFLKDSHPDIRLAALGLTKDRTAILRLHQLGIDCYIPKNSDPRQLEEMLKRIAVNRKDNPSPTQQTFGRLSADNADKLEPGAITAWPAVTSTERRYFRLAMSETSDKDIRRTLKLPESTFAHLVTGLYKQFGVRSRDGLVLALYRNRFMIMDDL